MDDEYNYNKNFKFIDSSREFYNKAKYNIKTEKRRRIRMVPDQIKYLEDCYKLNSKPTFEDRERIGDNIKLPEKNIQIWFQNRRAKERQEKKSKDGSMKDILKGKFYGCEKYDVASFNLNNDFEFD